MTPLFVSNHSPRIPERNLVDQLAKFTYNGTRTTRESWNGIPFFFNQFWTARQRQAARIHEVSYRACFKPQLPQFFIERLTSPGETVYDPFMGRGTTPIQAALMGRRPIGNDINPLSAMLTRPRLCPPSISAIDKRLGEIEWGFKGAVKNDLLIFYHPSTLCELHALKNWFSSRQSQSRFDEIDDWIRMVALNRLSGHSCGYFSVYTLPPNQAVSINAQRKINEKRNQTPPRRSVPEIILKKSLALLNTPSFYCNDFLLSVSPSTNTPQIGDGEVSLVITSPPFLDVVQYAQDNWLRCWFAGIDPSSVPISIHKKIEGWKAFIRATFTELARVVRKGGYIAFEVGEIKRGTVELEKVVIQLLDGLPFMPVCVVVNCQPFTKTSNCWGVHNNSKGTNTNRIFICKRN